MNETPNPYDLSAMSKAAHDDKAACGGLFRCGHGSTHDSHAKQLAKRVEELEQALEIACDGFSDEWLSWIHERHCPGSDDEELCICDGRARADIVAHVRLQASADLPLPTSPTSEEG